jgi:glycosyltransferase involved in cell wall biosynthesis
VIATLHDAIMLKHPEWCNPRLRSIKNFLIKQSLQWVNHVIAISKAMVPDLVELWGVSEKKITVVHQGISHDWLEKISLEKIKYLLEKLNIKQNFLLSVGTLQPRKNFIRVIQAYELLPHEIQKEFKLVLVGKDGWQSTEIRNEIIRMTAENKMVWLQYVSPEELRALYQSAQLLLFPSLSEGFGLPILEAFASNLPVITSNTTSLPEIAGDAAYFVDPCNIEEIKQSIVTLLTNTSLCTTLIKRGEERVKQFTLKKCAEETFKVYQTISH